MNTDLTHDSADLTRLRPYVPVPVSRWLDEDPDREYQAVSGSLVFADISGFTALTEQLSRRGKAGAEEMGDLLNATFEHLLAEAYAENGALLKWGGDAVLLSYTGPDHTVRACRAAQRMQRTIARVGRLRTSVGRVDLGMSIGVHSGQIDLVLATSPIRDLLVVGPAATAVTTAEKYAERGEVLISRPTAALLARELGVGEVGPVREGGGVLLEVPIPEASDRQEWPTPSIRPESILSAVEPSLRQHIVDGDVQPEHRHIAVGFIQFSGVDALLADFGPDAVVAALRHLLTTAQEAARSLGITLLSTDVNADGGKIILVSGAPLAQGDDETRLLAAMRQILDAESPLGLRGGVNHGRVFAGDYGPSYRRVYSIAGDCVNLAARLMAASEIGQIRVLASVLQAARSEYDVVELPPFAAKGKSEPVYSYALGRSLGADSRARDRSVMVGREHEVADLRRRIAGLTEQGQALELSGEHGMGKSRLLDEALFGIAAKVLRVGGDAYAADTPYAPWRRLMRQLLGVPQHADDPTVARTLSRIVEERAPELAPWLPLIGIVAGVELPATSAVEQLDAQFRRGRLESAMLDLLTALLAGPTVFAWEDPHLMDAASLDLIRIIGDAAQERPWMALVVRPTRQEQVFAEAAAEQLELSPLSDAAARALLQTKTSRQPLSPHRLDSIVERAAGNPLYLREILAAVQAGADVDALPTTVEQLAAARVDRLQPRYRKLLRTAAVLGVEVSLDDLMALVGEEIADLEPLGDFLQPLGPRRYEFEHGTLREAAYEGLSYTERRRLHRKAASVLEARLGNDADLDAALLSLHHEAAGQAEPTWRYALIAARRARSQYALQEAALLLRRALNAGKRMRSLDPSDRLAAYEALAEVDYALGHFTDAAAVIKRARRLPCDEPVRRAALRLTAARVHERSGNLPRALATLSRALSELDGRNLEEVQQVRSRLLARYGYIKWMQGKGDQAEEWIREAHAVAQASGEVRALAFALRLLDLIDLDRGTIDGSPHSEPAVGILRELGDQVELGHTFVGLGARAYYQGRWTEAVEHYQAALECFRAAGDRWNAATQEANLAEILIDQSLLDDARQLLDEALPVWRASGQVGEIAFGLALLGRAEAKDGEPARGLEHLAEALAGFTEIGESGSVRWVRALQVEATLAAGDPAAALSSAEEALADFPPTDPWTPMLWRVIGLAQAQLGRTEDGIASLVRSAEIAGERSARHEQAFAWDALLSLEPELFADLAVERDQIFGELGIRG